MVLLMVVLLLLLLLLLPNMADRDLTGAMPMTFQVVAGYQSPTHVIGKASLPGWDITLH